VRIWHKKGVELAAESLYAEPEPDADAPAGGDEAAKAEPEAK
jgi:hypothetical protein